MMVPQTTHTKVWDSVLLQGQIHRANEVFIITACKASAEVTVLDVSASMESFDFSVDTELGAVARMW